MRDFRKFCRPKTTKYPQVGDVLVKLNCGSTVYVKAKNYLSIKKSFKINSIVGETSNTAGNIKVFDKLLNREIAISAESYIANLDRFELINIIGSRFDPSNGHDYIEIGGIKWATVNVGAEQSSDTGLYFQWGDTQGYTAEQVGSRSGQKYFSWEDYKYCNGTLYDITKYNATDGKTVLEAVDDAATAAWGSCWRIPTIAEFQALNTAVNSVWTNNYQGSGVAGFVFTDKTDSSKVLFFPAMGYCKGGIYYVGSIGNYWSSSLFSDSLNSDSYSLYFENSNKIYVNSSSYRYYGCLVRGVIDENLIPDGVELVLTGDIICHNNLLNKDIIFSYEDWINLDDSWKLVGILNIKTYDEEHALDGDYVIMSNGHTLIIKPEDYSKVSDNWEIVDTITGVYIAVDLGLPSGTKWATMNVGASAPEDYGNYYMYGYTTPYDSSDTPYSGTEDPLSLEHDTARVNWGGNWRIPTKTEFDELEANTTYEWTTINGVNGGKFTSQNGNYIFFPAAGGWYNGSQNDVGRRGYYFSSTPDSSWAYFLDVEDNGLMVSEGGFRKAGYSVRGVVG